MIGLAMNYANSERVKILYKIILKLHKGLPQNLQVIGTNYVRDEFKRHKSCKEEEAEIFMKEWTNYAISLAEQMGIKGPQTGRTKIGTPLLKGDIEKLRDEQVYQLYELMKEASNLTKNEKSIK